jgi:hypothetical protein
MAELARQRERYLMKRIVLLTCIIFSLSVCHYAHSQSSITGNERIFITPQQYDQLAGAAGHDCTAAYKAITQALMSAGGGRVVFGPGIYEGNWNLSNLGNTSIVIEGAGKFVTTLNSTSGITLDICSTSRITIRDLGIKSTGGQVALLSGRYSTYIYFGAGHTFDNIVILGTPSVAGHYAVGSEESIYIACEFDITSSAPNMYIGVNNTDLPYTSPNGTLAGTSAGVWSFNKCSFVKDSGTEGPNVQLGSSLASILFQSCYFHGAPSSSGIQFIGSNNRNITITDSFFESNFLMPGQICYGIHFTSSRNNDHFQIRDNYFSIKKRSSLSPAIYMDITSQLHDSNIAGNSDVYGHGASLSNLINCTVEWVSQGCSLTSQGDSGASSISVDRGAAIYGGDHIYIGNALAYSGVNTQAVAELNTAASSGTSITLGEGKLINRHAGGDSVWYGQLSLTNSSVGSSFRTSMPVNITGSVMTLNSYSIIGESH